MRGASTAGIPGIAVVSGPCSRTELEEAGADVVFDTLDEFPAWFSSFAASLTH